MDAQESAGSQTLSQRLVFPAKPDCLLTIGSQHLAAILAEEWDTGLLVLIQGNPLFWVEDIGVFQTLEGEIAVRVSNIVNVETDEDETASSLPVFRIGLARLGPPGVKVRPESVPAEESRPKLRSLLPLDRIRISRGGLVGFVLIVTPLLVVVSAWRCRVPQADSVAAHSMIVDAPETPSSSPASGLQPAVTAAPAVPDPPPEILRLPGVEPFLKLEVAKKLQLTPSQVGAFGRLNQTTQEALEDLEKYWESDGRLELAQRRNVLLKAARQEALQVLTDRQRQTWEAMTR